MVHEVVVPGSLLLVPGVAGASDPLALQRTRVLAELVAALDGPGARVRVAAPGRAARRGRLRPDLGASGVDPRWAAWTFTGNDAAADGAAGAAATTALLALGGAGWSGPVDVVESVPAPPGRPGAAVVTVERDGEAW